MRVWFSADLHLGHGNIIKYCNRPFLTEEERQRAQDDPRGRWRVSDATVRRHDDALLEAINNVVEKGDRLWILGDFCMGRQQSAFAYRERILCQDVRLVWGNHDHDSVGQVFDYTTHQEMIHVQGQAIWLCHYPLRSWDRRFHGSWSLYGHVHGRLSREDDTNPHWLTRDIGVDACDYRPWSFEEIRDWMAPRIEAFQRQKDAVVQGHSELA